MVDRGEYEYVSRFFILQLLPNPSIQALVTRWNDDEHRFFSDGKEVILSSQQALDPDADRLVPTGFDRTILPNRDSVDVQRPLELRPGPSTGHYLIRAGYASGKDWKVNRYRWFLFDRAQVKLSLFASDTDGTLLDLIYHQGRPWALYRVDSLTLDHRAFGATSPRRILSLPDTLGEPNSHAEYESGQLGLSINFHCGNCGREPSRKFLDLLQDSSQWLPSPDFPLERTLRQLIWAQTGSDGKTVTLRRKDRLDDTAVFDFTPYLK